MPKLPNFLTGNLAKAFLGTAAVSMVGRVFQLIMAVLLARALEPSGYGTFTFATGLALIGGRLGSLGFPVLMMRFIPAYLTDKDWPKLKAVLWVGPLCVLVASSLIALGFLGLANFMGQDYHLYEGMRMAAILFPVMSFQALVLNQIAGFDHPRWAQFVNAFIPPLLVVCLAVALGVESPVQAVGYYCVAQLIGVLIGFGKSWAITPSEVKTTQSEPQVWFWIKTALPSLFGLSAMMLMKKSDILMLGPLSDLEQVGYYGAAFRLTFFLTAPVALLVTLLGPRMSGAIAAKRFGQLRKLLKGGVLFSLAIAVSVGLIFALFSQSIIFVLFGVEYAPAGQVLVILCFGQVAGALTTPLISFLLMGGDQNYYGFVSVAGLVLNVLLNLILIPPFGATGAAIATSASLIVLSLALLIRLRPVYAKLRAVGSAPFDQSEVQ